VERLIYIVEDLDMITKFEVGDLNLDYSEFDIVELIQNVFDLLENESEKRISPLRLKTTTSLTHYKSRQRPDSTSY
jgi:two-component system phosphate regulon sensor histidine kinase PhoR